MFDIEWRTHPKFPNYLFSSNGDIKNIVTKKLVTGSSKEGYNKKNIFNKNNLSQTLMTHRIIAEIFVDNPNNYKFIKHIDNDKLNNEYTNLQWVKQYCRTENLKINKLEGEIWKNIINYPDYQISNKGRIKNVITNTLMKIAKQGGYFRISLISPEGNRKHYYIHRIVAQAFLDNPENKPNVDHIDRNRLNNNLENLRWATNAEQNQNKSKQKSHKKFFKDKELLNYDDEIWKDINEFIPEVKNYKISSYGRIKNEKDRIFYGTKSGCGNYKYSSIGIKKKYYTHILVALAFIPNPDNKKVVNHKDGNGFNNAVTNLEWVTFSENGKHAMANNLHSKSRKIKIIYIDTKKEEIYNNKEHIVTSFNMSKNTINRYMKSQKPYKNMLFEYA